MKLLSFVSLCWAGVSLADTSNGVSKSDYDFESYVKEFGKSYSANEYQRRKAIFDANWIRILDNERSGSYEMGVNHLTDHTEEELPTGYDALSSSAHYEAMSLKSPRQFFNQKPLDLSTVDLNKLPKEVDWRTRGRVITPVKNQGHCGSCWAFASTAVLESHIAIQTGKLFSLSMQELVSCVPNPRDCGGEGGCQGSTAELAFDFVSHHGMTDEFNFGYQSFHGSDVNCTILPINGSDSSRQYHSVSTTERRLRRMTARQPSLVRGAVASIAGFSRLPSNQYDSLMVAVATIGPVAVSVAASGWGLYKGGVFRDDESTRRIVNHMVALEGYGTDQDTGEDFWLIRNSWGPLWGEDGYIRLKRVDPSTLDEPESDCRMDDRPGEGVVCTKDENGKPITPKPVSVCGTSGILYDSSIPIGSHLV